MHSMVFIVISTLFYLSFTLFFFFFFTQLICCCPQPCVSNFILSLTTFNIRFQQKQRKNAVIHFTAIAHDENVSDKNNQKMIEFNWITNDVIYRLDIVMMVFS